MQLYAVVCAIGLAGILGAPWLAAAVGGCVMALMFLREDRRVAAEGPQLGTWGMAQMVSSVVIAGSAALAIFALGRLSYMIWTVAT